MRICRHELHPLACHQAPGSLLINNMQYTCKFVAKHLNFLWTHPCSCVKYPRDILSNIPISTQTHLVMAMADDSLGTPGWKPIWGWNSLTQMIRVNGTGSEVGWVEFTYLLKQRWKVDRWTHFASFDRCFVGKCEGFALPCLFQLDVWHCFIAFSPVSSSFVEKRFQQHFESPRASVFFRIPISSLTGCFMIFKQIYHRRNGMMFPSDEHIFRMGKIH